MTMLHDTLADRLKAFGFTQTERNEFVLLAGQMVWRITSQRTRLVNCKLWAHLRMEEVSEFVCRVFAASLTAAGQDVWLVDDGIRLRRYEQSIELLLLGGDESRSAYYVGDPQAQFALQMDLLQTRIMPMMTTLTGPSDYLKLLEHDLEPFIWARDNAVMRVLAIYYLTRCLNEAFPPLPSAVTTQFTADAGAAHQFTSIDACFEWLQSNATVPMQHA